MGGTGGIGRHPGRKKRLASAEQTGTGPEGATSNPLLEAWVPPFGLPPFDRVTPDHFRPAFDRALAEHRAEIAAIAGEPAASTFANTVDAFQRAGCTLDRVSAVFFGLAGAHTSDALQAVQREIAPVLARHRSAIFLDAALFRRVDDLFAQRERLGLTPEQARVLERLHAAFVRAGVRLDGIARERLAAIDERLAALGTLFGQNVLADERAWVLVLETEEDLAGLPDFVRAAAARAAADRGLEGRHAITLARSSVVPFLQFSSRRDLRERAFAAWTGRGDNGGDTDNEAIAAETLALRAERARLLDHPTYAHYRLDDTMAKTPEAVRDLLDRVWAPARVLALRERDELQAAVAEEGGNFALAPWDWRHYAEKVRRARHDLDEAEIKPYLQLDNMVAAAFDVAHRLFGISFTELEGLPVYHPDMRVWEVRDAGGRHVGLFLGDYFARPSKRSGAWMGAFRTQERLSGDVRPIVLNVTNFAKGGEGEPALLGLDDARTLFHEFGHALHGLLSDVTYPLLAGTRVMLDFVEFPSQLYEHWLERPEVLGRHAVHYRTGEAMPAELLERLLAARNFGQGFATVEYTASAIVDLDLHLLERPDGLDVTAFEAATLERIGMPAEIIPRHRTPHFAHVFSGGGYAAGYYSYLWSEMLDADGFAAFLEAGDAFDPGMAARLREFVYAAGNLRDPGEAYLAFRGRLPSLDPLLRQRGLWPSAGEA
jgi:peptidyl-dipeptidase Dcp